MNEKLALLRKQAMQLPLSPGVYIMKNKKSEIIYIGKAKALKNRVSQYFGSQNTHTQKVRKMVENVDRFDYILTDSEFEALVLECSLIKQYQPKYNILLKDDKGYNYIKVTKGEWPKISECKQILDDGANYIGPYTSSFTVKQAVDETLKIFKLPRCSKQFPRDYKKSRPCLNGFMGLCSAPCAGRITKEEYNESVNAALSFLKGGSARAISEMKKQMELYAEELQFEKAAKLRDRIAAIKNLNEKQKVVSINVPEEDVVALVNSTKKACFEVLRFMNGKLCDSEHFIIPSYEDEKAARAELIQNFYSMRERIPSRICVDGDMEDEELLQRYLSEKAGKTVRFIKPQKGEHMQILLLCKTNAQQHLAYLQGTTGKEMSALEELGKLLGLKEPPMNIEAYDISHTFGADNVAGMVVFRNGRAYKKAYKRFAIKGFDGQDDYGSMNEVLTRRLQRYVDEKGTNDGFGVLPDLILLDGGQGQVNAVLPVIKGFGFDIPVYGMVKDNKHRTRAIAYNGGEIDINSKRKAFTLVSSIQEEVHRFAVSYHHKKHKKSTFSSTITQIEGIGPAKAKALLKHFKTVNAIKNAGVDELTQVKGINSQLAEKIVEFYSQN